MTFYKFILDMANKRWFKAASSIGAAAFGLSQVPSIGKAYDSNQEQHQFKINAILSREPEAKDLANSWAAKVGRSTNLWKDLPQISETLYNNLDNVEEFKKAFLRLEELPKPLKRNLDLVCQHIEKLYGKEESNKLKDKLAHHNQVSYVPQIYEMSR